MTTEKTWTGTPPAKCDGCEQRIQRTFVDGRTPSGQWGIFCPGCRISYGVRLGTGLGQKYERRGDVYVKTAG